jgi:DNA-binding NtrC family response regulator
MPNKDGQELISEIEEKQYPFSAYILISGHGPNEPRIRSLMQAELKTSFYFCPKPFDIDAVAQILNGIYQGTLSNAHFACV